MKIEDRGVDITGVPGVERIRVADSNVEIQFPPTDGYPQGWSMDLNGWTGSGWSDVVVYAPVTEVQH